MAQNSERTNTLVWIDCEMTGLNPEQDVLLEIATIITDNDLNIIEQGPALVIHQEEKFLRSMIPIVKEMHTKSGLVDRIKYGASVQEAQEQTLEFIKKHCEPQKAPLCGNSVWADRQFLVKAMPQLIDYLNYRLVDVTTVKELVARWYPNDPNLNFKKRESHRALEDIKESIAELRHYREKFFIGLS